MNQILDILDGSKNESGTSIIVIQPPRELPDVLSDEDSDLSDDEANKTLYTVYTYLVLVTSSARSRTAEPLYACQPLAWVRVPGVEV